MVAISTFGPTLTIASRPLATSGIPFNKAATRVAALPNGQIVAIWMGETGYTDQFGVFLTRADVFSRTLNADGSFSSSETVVRENVAINSFSNGRPAPSITVLNDGRYVVGTQGRVTFVATDQGPTLQIFNANGTPSSGIILLSMQVTQFGFTSTATGWDPVLAKLSDGRFVTAWRPLNSMVAFRIFNSDGTNSSTNIIVTQQDSGTTGVVFTYDPTIAALNNGGFVVAWESAVTDGSGSSIHARVYNSAGTALGAEFQVNTTIESGQHEPSIVTLADGRFIVFWVSQDTADGDGTNIRGRIFSATGVASGQDFLVNTTAQGDQLVPNVAALDGGRFVVVWRSTDNGTGDVDTIRARVYEANGTAAGDFIVGTEPASDDEYPSVTALPDGRFAVSWWAWGGGSTVETRLQIFSVDAPHTVTGSPGNDVYYGGAASDHISGAGGNDQLSGLAGNDVLAGGAGTNTLNGGGGWDRASYSIAASAATITRNANGTTTIAGAGFSDTLTGVEVAHFTDKDVAIREVARGDFNGNGGSDMVLQSGGTVVDWIVTNGVAQTGNLIGGGVTGWTVKGTGDFNGDGTADVLLQNGGTVVQWTINGGVNAGGTLVGAGITGWTVVGTGDFNADGTTDVLLQNGGTVVDWIMQNGVAASGNVVGAGVTGWNVVGTGDFNGDGTSDVLLQNGGTVVAWDMKNGLNAGGTVLGSGVPGWTVVGTGDFNGDGTTDVVLQNGSTIVDWIVRNNVATSGNVIGLGVAGWSVVGTGDYNGDGTADIALQNGGTVVNWTMQNGLVASGNVLGGAGTFTVRG